MRGAFLWPGVEWGKVRMGAVDGRGLRTGRCMRSVAVQKEAGLKMNQIMQHKRCKQYEENWVKS